jgi:hypothetical protein
MDSSTLWGNEFLLFTNLWLGHEGELLEKWIDITTPVASVMISLAALASYLSIAGKIP